MDDRHYLTTLSKEEFRESYDYKSQWIAEVRPGYGYCDYWIYRSEEDDCEMYEDSTDTLNEAKDEVEEYLLTRNWITKSTTISEKINGRTKDYSWQFHRTWETFDENLQLEDWFYYTNLKDGNDSIFLVAYKIDGQQLEMRCNFGLAEKDGQESRYYFNVNFQNNFGKIFQYDNQEVFFCYGFPSARTSEEAAHNLVRLFIDHVISLHFGSPFVTNKHIPLEDQVFAGESVEEALKDCHVAIESVTPKAFSRGENGMDSKLVEMILDNSQTLPTDQPIKYDDGKNDWSLLPWLAIQEVVYILTLGARKYPARNWEAGFNYSRTFNALMRHLTAWWNREDNDPESGRSHLAHTICNALFLLHFTLTNTGTDDRPKYNDKQ